MIAVLPFKNLGGGPSSDLLVDSMTAGLIQQLSIIHGLQVRSQTSSFMFKESSKTGRETLPQSAIGWAANHVIEGDALR